jgi:hypothetical protein
MPATTLSTDQQGSALVSAAHKAGIPVSVLLGVYGMETAFGSNISTSSAGAVGPFQFLPSTAQGRGYPLTNTPTVAEFQQQADAAAGYLASLFKSHNSDWNAALTAYSGGGYGATDVAQKATHASLDLIDSIIGKGVSLGTGDTSVTGGTPATAGVQQASNTAQSVGQSVGQIASLITSTSFWLRIGEGLAAVLLIYLGLHALTGQSSSPGQQVKHVTRIIPV